MPRKQKRGATTLIEQLREAIAESVEDGQSLNELSRKTGVHVSRISRFVRGERSIDVAAASAICRALGYALAKVKTRTPKKDRHKPTAE